jgi:hypothetical protein
VLLALAVASLPLASAESRLQPALIPLATRLVPLDHALEAPAAVQAHLPDLTAASKILLAITSALVLESVSHSRLVRMAMPISIKDGLLAILRSRAPPIA